MFRHGVRLTSVLAGVTASVLLVAAPSAAWKPQQAVPLPTVFPCAGSWTNVIEGTEHDDDILGTEGNDLIIGLGGNDTVYGGAGRDTILGGDGDDLLAGGPADDCILGGAGADHSVQWVFSVPNGNDDTYSATVRYEY